MSYDEYIEAELETYIVVGSIMLVNLILMLVVCPYACARGCCRGCKKDHTRSDYRKAEKNRPGVWYLICAVFMILVQMSIMFELTNVYFFSKDTLCKEAKFIDIVNIGKP